MGIVDRLHRDFMIATRTLPDTLDAIGELRNFTKIELPTDYVEFKLELAETEIKVRDDMYIRFWDAQGCIELNGAYNIQKYLSPETLAIGDDEGGGALVFMTGDEGFGIYHVHFSYLCMSDAVKVASSVSELLLDGVGIDVLLKRY